MEISGNLAIILFILASVITVFAAKKLAAYGDAIAETTNLGQSLVGLVLLSLATSLPEFFSSSSASFFGNVDLSFGNVFGSNMTNIFIIVIMDFFVRNKPILYFISQRNIVTGGIVIVVSSFVFLMMYIAHMPQTQGFNFWYFSIIIIVIYMIGMFVIYQYEKKNADQASDLEESQSMESPVIEGKLTKKQAITGFIVSSAVVFCAAILLSKTSDVISSFPVNGKPLGGTFVGTLFMAFTTSLPEIVVSIAAVRMGNFDMALGNLFGSNLFNLAILAFSDGFYRLGKLFGYGTSNEDAFTIVSQNHFISGFIGVIFVGIVLSSLMLRKDEKKGFLGYDTLTIGLLYIASLYLLFVLR